MSKHARFSLFIYASHAAAAIVVPTAWWLGAALESDDQRGWLMLAALAAIALAARLSARRYRIACEHVEAGARDYMAMVGAFSAAVHLRNGGAPRSL